MINLSVNLVAHPGKQEELMQSLRFLKEKIASEAGCVACRVYQNPDNPDEFVVFEQWENVSKAAAHLESQNLAVLVGASSVLSQDIRVSLSEEPSIVSMEQIFHRRIVKEEK